MNFRETCIQSISVSVGILLVIIGVRKAVRLFLMIKMLTAEKKRFLIHRKSGLFFNGIIE